LYIGATLPTVISTMTKTRHRYPKNKDIIRASEPQVQKLSFRELVRSHADGLFR
jgi:electron transfer flavoprotein alpha/beta subunit